MKKIALLCVICLLFTILPSVVGASSDITISVTNVSQDIVTVSGSAPVDTIVTVMVLNPDKSVSDITTSNIDAVQYMGSVYSKAGKFTCDVKMNTGSGSDKTEGVFTVLVSINGKLVYTNENFVFYSNDTKLSYVNDLKTATKSELLAIEEDPYTKIEKIFETYSLSNHELYSEAELDDLATVITAQNSRLSISAPTDVDTFLMKVLVLNAFDNSSASLIAADGNIKYTDFWAKNGSAVDSLYTDNFVNDLSAEGKAAVAEEMINADYNGAQFTDIFPVFEDAMLYNLIMNNIAMGSGHIEGYVLNDFNSEYEAAGFDTELLSSIKSKTEKVSKLNKVLNCDAKSLSTLATKFNSIMEDDEDDNSGSSGGSSGGGGGGGSSSLPSTSVPSGGGAAGFVGGTEAPTPTVTPAPTTEPDAPSGNYPFTDMSGSTWANEAVEYLYANKIINGRSETEFAPTATVTRAELVKMICEAMNVAEAAEGVSFSDVNDADWFASYVNRAAAAGIVNGSNGQFNPNGGVSREDAALIIFRALGLEVSGEMTFTDSDTVSDYAKEAIASMVNAGYISGMGDGTFAPKATLTRAQAAQLIYNALTKGGAAE